MTSNDILCLCVGFASILKNYVEGENSTLCMLTSFNCMDALRRIKVFLPPRINLFDDLRKFLKNIYIQPHGRNQSAYGRLRHHQIYDLPTVPFIELKRTRHVMADEFDNNTFLSSIVACAMKTLKRDDSKVLSVLYERVLQFNKGPPRRKVLLHEYLKDHVFISPDFDDPAFQESISDLVSNCKRVCKDEFQRAQVMKDLQILHTLVHEEASTVHDTPLTDKAIIKGVLFQTTFNSSAPDVTPPSLMTMANNPKKKEHRVNFIGVRYDYNSSTYMPGQTPDDPSHCLSFGIPRYFRVIDCTSYLVNVPVAIVSWIQFKITKCHRNTVIGTISSEEWRTGPIHRPHMNVLPLMHALPSRFVLAFNPIPLPRTARREIAFIGIDQDKLGLDVVDHDHVIEFGIDAKTQYKYDEYVDDNGSKHSVEFTEAGSNFLKTQFYCDDIH